MKSSGLNQIKIETDNRKGEISHWIETSKTKKINMIMYPIHLIKLT